MTFSVSAFYKFVAIGDCAALRASLLDLCRAHNIKGTILLAYEGINGTVAGSPESIDYLETWLRSDARFAGLESKQSQAMAAPFQRLKVKIKREIVTFGVPEADPAVHAGTYVEAKDWNALIADADVTLIDTRNAYEVKVGTFPGSLDPGTCAFNDFPQFVNQQLDPIRHRKIAMFCTGGIRCEKASAYLRLQGFDQVYHLKGGILKYLETVPRDDSVWQGECFVFDERVALAHGLEKGAHRLCEGCGHPILLANAEAEGTATSLCPNCQPGVKPAL